MKKKNKVNIFKLSVSSDKLVKIRKIVSPDLIYNKIKFRNEIYSIGDHLMIRDEKEGFLIAKLIKINQTGGLDKYSYWPSILVQW